MRFVVCIPQSKNPGYTYGNRLVLEKRPDTKNASWGPVQKKGLYRNLE